jgi:hypothetical protein
VLRILRVDAPWHTNEINVFVSTGSGLFGPAAPIGSVDAHSLLVALPERYPSLVRLTLPSSAKSDLDVALFLSRHDPLETIAPCRTILEVDGKTRSIRRDDESVATDFQRLAAGETVHLTVKGPTYLKALIRLPWPNTASAIFRSFQLFGALDEQPFEPVEMATEWESRHRVRIDREPAMVSRQEECFFSIPEGDHSFRLSTPVEAYVSLRRLDLPDYLVPSLNGPRTHAEAVLRRMEQVPSEGDLPSLGGLQSSPLRTQRWNEGQSPSEASLTTPAGLSLAALPPAPIEQLAWRLARDNEPREASAQAADLLARFARWRRDYPAAQEAADQLRRLQTFYREIVPEQKTIPGPVANGYFLPWRLRELFQPERPWLLSATIAHNARALLPQGCFIEMPRSAEHAHVYRLPPRSFESQLRIVVTSDLTHGQQEFFVQCDAQPPLQFELHRPRPIPASGFEGSIEAAALAVMQVLAQPSNAVTRLPRLIETGLDGPLLQTDDIELALPQSVREIRVYQDPANAGELRVSLAYRTAKPFVLDETGYQALSASTHALQILTHFLAVSHAQEPPSSAHPNTNDAPRHAQGIPLPAHPSSDEEPAAHSARDPAQDNSLHPDAALKNQWLSLLRLLEAHDREFRNSLETPESLLVSSASLSETATEAIARQARAMEQDAQWIEALALWNRLARNPASQVDGFIGVARCLKALGEPYLREQYLRSLLLFFPEAKARNYAFAELAALYEQTGEDELLEALHAVMVLECPCAEHLAGLLPVLARNGRHEMVLSIGLALPPATRPAERILRSAACVQAWATFDQLVGTLDSPDPRAYWQAFKALTFGNDDEAERLLRQSGELGQPTWASLQEGRAIRTALGANDASQREPAGWAWQEWWHRQPGIRTWRSQPDLISDFAGAIQVYSVERDLYSPHFQATPSRPVQLRFIGPLRLRLDTRLLLPATVGEPVDDWLLVEEHGRTNRFPITQSIPSQGLTLTGYESMRPTIKTSVELAFGPGCHELRVSAATYPVLVQTFEEQPELPWPILPRLNGAILTAALANTQSTTHRALPVKKVGPLFLFEDQDVLAFTDQLIADAGVHPLSADVTWANLAATQVRGTSTHEAPSVEPPPRDFTCLRTPWTGDVQPQEVQNRLAQLVEIAEFEPVLRETAQIAGEMLVFQHGMPPQGQDLLARLTSDREWAPLPITPSSAGLRIIETAPDAPESIPLRIRQALLPPAPIHAFVISGAHVFTWTLKHVQPRQVQVRVQLDKAGLQPAAAMNVLCQIDDQPPVRMSLTPAQPAQATQLTAPVGDHCIRVWIDDPVINQFIRLVLNESVATVAGDAVSVAEEPPAREMRAYQIATRQEPVHFTLTGPALLRVDEWRQGQSSYQHRTIEAGIQTVTLLPPEGRSEALYRVFQRITRTNAPVSRRVITQRELVPVPPPRLVLPGLDVPSVVALSDFYRLGRQEDGTGSVGLQMARCRPFEIANNLDRVANEFIEGDLSYRKQSKSETLWFRTDLLGRLHQQGDATVGLREWIFGDPKSTSWNWRWEGAAYLGHLTGSQGPAGSEWEASLQTSAFVNRRWAISPRMDHTPFAGGFARYLTLDDGEARGFDYIDQDLFSYYRYQHRWGLLLGDQLQYRPWLDTEWNATVSLTSNEDFNLFRPDHWGMRLAWLQLLGPARVEAAYQFKHFFEDSDRNKASYRHAVSLEVAGEHWIRGRHRIEAGLLVRHDWPDEDNSFFLTIAWHFSNGRGYRDYHSRETDFREIRRRNSSGSYNNGCDPELNWLTY